MDCDVLTTTHPLISQDIYNGFNEVATYKLFGWTTLKDAKRFLWSHYNPDGVCIFLRRIVNRIKFLDKKTFYVRSASDTTRTCNRNIYGWSPSKYTLEGPTTDGIRIPKLTPTRRSGRKGRQIVASPVLSSLVDFFRPLFLSFYLACLALGSCVLVLRSRATINT